MVKGRVLITSIYLTTHDRAEVKPTIMCWGHEKKSERIYVVKVFALMSIQRACKMSIMSISTVDYCRTNCDYAFIQIYGACRSSASIHGDVSNRR